MKIPYTVRRSIVIDAGPRTLYQLARDMKQSKYWSPWYVMAPGEAVSVTAGDGKAVGSIHAWDGIILGTGEQEIVELKADKLIRHDLRFTAPFKSTAEARMTFKKVKKGTKVTWELDSTLPFFMAPLKKMFIALIGMDFERGLSMLKQHVETGAVHSKVSYEGAVEAGGFRYVGIKTTSTIDKMQKSMDRDFKKLEKWATKAGVKPGKAFSIYHKYDFVSRKVVYTAGFMTSERMKGLADGMKQGRIKGGKAFTVLHKGDYQNLGNAWTGGMMYLRSHKIKSRKKVHPMEVYLNDPRKVQAKNLRTMIYLPIKG